MPAHLDHPQPGVPFDPVEFWILGWLWLPENHSEVAAIEAWHGETLLGQIASAALFERPDVSAQLAIPPGVATGFAFAAHHLTAPTHPFELSLCARLRDGTRTAPVFTSFVTPPSPEHDPLGALRASQPPTARGLEVGAHARPSKGLSPYFSDMVASYAGTSGRVDFLADAVTLPLSDATLDYLCSSHVLEHLPNPLVALHEWHRVLRPGGSLYLVVPDKRYTFDLPRTVTPVRHLLHDFLHGVSPADIAVHIDEFVYHTDWDRLRPNSPRHDRVQQQATAKAYYLDQLFRGEALDVHYHTFTPASLKSLLHAAGFIGGAFPKFDLVMDAERYPPDRIDGIALLLRKRSRSLGAPPPRKTFALPHAHATIAPLPLVCPLSLEPLTLETSADGSASLLAPISHRRYPHQGSLPDLRPPSGLPARRPWSNRLWRRFHHALSRLRLAATPPPS